MSQEIGSQWYALHVVSGCEEVVRTELASNSESLGISSVRLPVDVIHSESSRKKETIRILFPGYIFVKLPKLDRGIFVGILQISGVVGFLGIHSPRQLDSAFAEKVLELNSDGEFSPKIQYELEEVVVVMDGPFRGCLGRIKELSLEKGLATLEVAVFGRQTPVKIELASVQKV